MKSVIVLLFGVLFFAVGVLLLLKQLKIRKSYTLSATAEVTDYKTELHRDGQGENSSYVHYPVMRYYVSGKWYEKTSEIGLGSRKYEIGGQVSILCDPQNPENFAIAEDRTYWIMSVAFILAGIGICILSFTAKV